MPHKLEQGFHVGTDDHARTLPIPEDLYTALVQYLDSDKPSGSLEIHFHNGGVTAITGTKKVIYKGANQKSS